MTATQWDNPTSGVFHGNSRKLGIADLHFGPRKAGYHTHGHETILPGRFPPLTLMILQRKLVLKDPLPPREDEREGYVPNVVYSAVRLHNNSLILPYADYLHLWVVDLAELICIEEK
jgi:hypothetical protein